MSKDVPVPVPVPKPPRVVWASDAGVDPRIRLVQARDASFVCEQFEGYDALGNELWNRCPNATHALTVALGTLCAATLDSKGTA